MNVAIIGGMVMIVVVMLIALFVIFLVIAVTKSHRLRIRDPTNHQAYIKEYMVFEKKDKRTNQEYWISVPLLCPKLKVERPPAKAIEVGKKGRKYAEAYQVSAEDELLWITDSGIKTKKNKDGKIEIYDIEGIKDGKEKLKLIDTFKPFSMVQRDTVVAQFKKAEEISKGKWSSDKIMTLISVGAVVILVVCLMVFWADIAKPALESHKLALQTQEQNIKIMQSLGIKTNNIAQNIEGQSQGGVVVQGSEEPPIADGT